MLPPEGRMWSWMTVDQQQNPVELHRRDKTKVKDLRTKGFTEMSVFKSSSCCNYNLNVTTKGGAFSVSCPSQNLLRHCWSSDLLSHETSPVPGQLLVTVLVLAELGSPLQVLQDGVSSLRWAPDSLQGFTLPLISLLQSIAAGVPHQGLRLP